MGRPLPDGDCEAPLGEFVRAINPSGDRAPLVLLNPWPKDRDRFTVLRAHIPRDQPVFELLPPGRRQAPKLRRVEDWVRLYHDQGLARLPFGPPFHIAGWSFGGVVAYEMARRLPDDIGFVGLIDTWYPRGYRPLTRGGLVTNRILAAMSGGMDTSVRRVISAEYRYERRQWAKVTARARSTWGIRVGSAEPRSDQDEVSWAISRALWGWQARPSEAFVTHFPTAETLSWQGSSPPWDWARMHRGGFDVVPLDGGHFTIWTEPGVGQLAAGLTSALERWCLQRPPSADRQVVAMTPRSTR